MTAMTVEVEAKAASLNSNDCFVLVSNAKPKETLVWLVRIPQKSACRCLQIYKAAPTIYGIYLAKAVDSLFIFKGQISVCRHVSNKYFCRRMLLNAEYLTIYISLPKSVKRYLLK